MAKKDNIQNIDFDIFKTIQKDVNDKLHDAVLDTDTDKIVKTWIPTGSCMLDTIISNRADVGGFPCGRVIEIAGWESSGKTLLALEAVRSVQNMGGYALYIDIEHSLDFEWIASLGIDIKKVTWVSNIDTVEQVFETIEIALQKIEEHYPKLKNKPILVVWDSLAATTTKTEQNSEYDDHEMAQRARSIGRSLRKINTTLNKFNVCFMILNQLRQNVGNIYQKETTPGGNSPKFMSSVRMHMTRTSPIEKGPEKIKATIGYNTKVKIIKNKVGPNRRVCSFDILFSKGLDETLSIFDFLVSVGAIDLPKAARSFTFDYGKGEEKYVKEKWPELFNTNADIRQWAQDTAKKHLVIDLTNLDYTRGKISNLDMFDFEHGVIKENYEIVDNDTGEVVGFDDDDEEENVETTKKKKKK